MKYSEIRFWLIILVAYASFNLSAQGWEQRDAGDLTYQMMTPYETASVELGKFLSYSGRNYYVTANALVNNTIDSASTPLEKSRFYTQMAATAASRVGGRILTIGDTTLHGRHMFYTTISVRHNDTTYTEYQLLEYVYEDTLYAFSFDYQTDDAEVALWRNQFFASIQPRKTAWRVGQWLPIVALVMVLIVVASLIRRKNK